MLELDPIEVEAVPGDVVDAVVPVLVPEIVPEIP
jgi:hypothetical protein